MLNPIEKFKGSILHLNISLLYCNGDLTGLLTERLKSWPLLHTIKQISRTAKMGKPLIFNDIPTGTLL